MLLDTIWTINIKHWYWFLDSDKEVKCFGSPSVRLFLNTWPSDLQIYAVTPVSDISDVPQLERVPERIKSFYRINNVSRFHYDRPFHKGPKDRENEFRVRGDTVLAKDLIVETAD